MLVLPQLYIDMHYTRHKKSTSRLRRLMAWLPSLILTIWAVCLAMSPNFMPDNKMLLSLFLVLLGLFGIPMALFALCSFVGWRWCKWRHKRINWGNLIGIIAALFAVFVLLWGSIMIAAPAFCLFRYMFLFFILWPVILYYILCRESLCR